MLFFERKKNTEKGNGNTLTIIIIWLCGYVFACMLYIFYGSFFVVVVGLFATIIFNDSFTRFRWFWFLFSFSHAYTLFIYDCSASKCAACRSRLLFDSLFFYALSYRLFHFFFRYEINRRTIQKSKSVSVKIDRVIHYNFHWILLCICVFIIAILCTYTRWFVYINCQLFTLLTG